MFLGLEVQREGELGEITLSQSQYIENLLQRHGIKECRAAATPLDAGFQITCDKEGCKIVNEQAYQAVIGELMWLALSSRPDILHSVSKLAQRNKDPHSENLTGVKHVLRYLASTKDLKLHYKISNEPLTGYVDADWGGDKTDRKSNTGYLFYLAGGPISWKSEKQRSVALVQKRNTWHYHPHARKRFL
ncbi:secreted RxLR effector protein 161-like [Drosophila santomea]|uniref:secreted RxLR effector protein 161-like n=1 Tax=Drosophila santomea TaxID=129105 RepID=UPI001CCA7FAD|nr:secreted RxLR effector protein 161-like [Drosophila santomea]